jgi:hypothetical protein
MTFSKHVRKFNRELLKATCQVIGCKPGNAHQIAEKVFEEINLILNNLSESLTFENHFCKYASGAKELNYGRTFSLEEDLSTIGVTTKGKKYEEITTITTSATLFKFILSRFLEKYKYYRPEYLKDFYIASDLVCKDTK